MAFLNRFGTTDNKYHVSEDQLLVLDSDEYNFIRYFLDGRDPEYITKDDLASTSKLLWVGPTAAVEKNGYLYILANLTHQVSRISRKDYSAEIYLGSGIPTKGAASGFGLNNAQLGYPVSMKLIDDQFWIGDAFGRRIIYVNEANLVDQLFPPPHWNDIGSVTGLTKLNGVFYFVDHTFGKVYELNPNDPKINWAAGSTPKNAPSDSEKARRFSSNQPVKFQTSAKEAIFGLPVSIDAANGKLYISNTFCSGIWEVNLREEIASPVSGMKSHADYHFGSFPANAGFAGKDLRLASPRFIYSEQNQLFFITAEFHQRAAVINKDFTKACEIKFDIPLTTIAPGTILHDSRIVILDSSQQKVHFFKATKMTCLTKIISPETIQNVINSNSEKRLVGYSTY